LQFPGRERVEDLLGRVRPARLELDAEASIDNTPHVGRIIEGDMLRVAVTLIRDQVACDLVIADPPWPAPDFRYNTAWEDDPNTPAGGSSTTDLVQSELSWLRFMKPRLEAMRSLVASTGVLVLTSEHRNLFRVGQLVDEVFGVDNRLTVLGYAKAYSHRGRAGTTYDYLIATARDREAWLSGPGASRDPDPPQWWTLADLGDPPLDPTQPGYKTSGINELTEVIGPGHRFYAAKPSSLYRKIIETWCPDPGTVLDPFSGSGAAGHAVLDLNAAGAERRFILIDEIEETPPQGGIARTIAATRVRRLISGAWHNGSRQARQGGYTFETLA